MSKVAAKKLGFDFRLFILPILIFSALILAFGGVRYINAASNGLALWAACVLPAVFPYLVITALLTNLNVASKSSKIFTPLCNRVFKTSGICGYAFLMSIISGYPIGAKIVCDLKNNSLITETEATKAAAFCSTPSPMFLIGSVGNIMFKSATFGLKLFLINIVASLIVGFVFSFYKRKENVQKTPLPFTTKKADNILYESVYSSVISVLIVGGLITVFSVLIEMLSFLKVLDGLTYSLNAVFNFDFGLCVSYGLLECTAGLKLLSSFGINNLSFILSAVITAFGGACVIIQSMAFLKSAKIKAAPFLLAKGLQATLCLILSFICCLLFPL